MKNKKAIIIFLIIFLPLVIFLVIYNWRAFRPISHSNKVDESTSQTVGNENTNTNQSAANINTNSSISTSEEVEMTGRVFIKGYGTASESYGILSTAGHEIGLGGYDSMKEQFRPYVNDNIKVIFSSICKSTNQNCCLSLFYYCGTVKDWQPLE